jgi:hypothetical protein
MKLAKIFIPKSVVLGAIQKPPFALYDMIPNTIITSPIPNTPFSVWQIDTIEGLRGFIDDVITGYRSGFHMGVAIFDENTVKFDANKQGFEVSRYATGYPACEYKLGENILKKFWAGDYRMGDPFIIASPAGTLWVDSAGVEAVKWFADG